MSAPGMDDLFRRLAAAQDRAVDAAPAGTFTPPVRPARGWLRIATAGVALASVIAAVVVWRGHQPLRFAVGPAGTEGAAGTALVAGGEAHLPLRFSDGSAVEFQAGARGRVQRLGGAGAEVVLESGRLDAQIRHAERTRWLFRAGPFEILVTGTRFLAEWTPETSGLVVTMREGSVLVTGPGVPDGGAAVRAGQELRARAGSVVVGAPATAVAAPAPTPPTAEPAPLVESAPRPAAPDWAALADRGAYAAALRAAERTGFARLCAELDARALLSLGDAARFAGDARRAEQAFAALVDRFPRAALAADAVFSLGRLSFEAGRPADAARWFELYLARWPRAPLAEQAAGRAVESHVRAADPAAARAAARRYLSLHPTGIHAATARRALGEAAP